ncbi:MAG: division/cell wall cluster transcriptional repressor MraZ [Deltaproteobacteria bacterium]|nr:division/cell wall cluster transcriptional repressor MraZ [Deltaproteobacteria bacterium]
MDRRTFLKGMLFGLTPLHFSSFLTNTDQPKEDKLQALPNHEKAELTSNEGTSFDGSFFCRIDSKRRVMIPVKFLEVIKVGGTNGVVVTRMDSGLSAYTFKEWDKIAARIEGLARKNPALRRFRRIFVGGAHDCCCDKRGRILIPPILGQYADLEKEVVLAGLHDHFEIWSRKNWNKEP